MSLRVTPIGAAQQVGRSCILLEIGGARVLLDCGISPKAGSMSADHIPDFSFLTRDGTPMADAIDLVIITHFHLDHIGSLPYLTEVLGYTGPLLMTQPTRAVAKLMFDDYLKVNSRKAGSLYNADQIDACLSRVVSMQLHERVQVGEADLFITPYYAGHVLGAVMVMIECGGHSAFYTGDFTMTPDTLLAAANAPIMLRPDVVITEATYATTIRTSKRQRELEVLQKIQHTLEEGGKVLLSSSAVGLSHQICQLCEAHWKRMGLDFPIRISRGMSEKSMAYFKLFSSWLRESLRHSEGMFTFPHVTQYERYKEMVQSPGPMVLIASPGSFVGGQSLEALRALAPDQKNLVVMPGYSLPGTPGHELQAGSKVLQFEDGSPPIHVNCRVEYMHHSDHADSRGILMMLSQLAPRHVVLVHGETSKLRVFKHIVEQRMRLPCSVPQMGQSVDCHLNDYIPVLVSPTLLREAELVAAPPVPPMKGDEAEFWGDGDGAATVSHRVLTSPPSARNLSGCLRKRKAVDDTDIWELFPRSATGLRAAGLQPHALRYRHEASVHVPRLQAAWAAMQHAGAELSWEPAAPPNTGPLPQGAAFTLSVCSPPLATCRLEHVKANKANMRMEWTRGAEEACPSLRDLLEAAGVS